MTTTHTTTHHQEHQSVAHLRAELDDQFSFRSESDPVSIREYSATPTNAQVKSPWLTQPLVVVVLGASGDLAKKKTYPSLLELHQHGLLPPSTVIWGYARSPKTDEQFREHLKHHLVGEKVDEFLEMCHYFHGSSYGDVQAYGEMLKEISNSSTNRYANTLYYFAIPPNIFADTVNALQSIEGAVVEGRTRLVIEKPFGRDTASCQELLDHFGALPETLQYRLDHYLAKPMVESLSTIRQANPWLESLWSHKHIQSVHIRFKEPFGTQGRGGYFDQFNIIRDVLQNHLLQVLLLVAMELPDGDASNVMDAKDSFRQAKIAVLEQMPPILLQDSLLGQYDGYKDDPTITNKETTCPTYAALRCFVNSDRWKGVPFILEAGKALDQKVVDVQIQFKNRAPFPPNTMTIEIQPEAKLSMETHFKPVDSTSTAKVTTTPLTANYTSESPTTIENAYTRLLWDVLNGNSQNFVRADELIKSWQVFTPLLHQLERDIIDPESYAYGSDGPTSRGVFLKEMTMAGGVKAAL